MEKGSSRTDYELVRRTCVGDNDAFRMLVEKYKDLCFSLACSILKNEADAEDVLQDVFVKVYEKIDTFRFDSAFATWLYRIVVNASLNHRTKNRTTLFSDSEGAETKIADLKESFDDLRDEERKRYIKDAFMRLKDVEALVLRLYYLCDLSVSEIVSITDLTESNTKIMLHRGRKNLYTVLSSMTGNDIKSLL